MINGNLPPQAILLLQVRQNASAAERTTARVHLAARANDYHYAVVDVFELDGNPVKDEATFGAVADLARRTGANLLLVSPDLTDQRARQIAREKRMTVVRLP